MASPDGPTINAGALHCRDVRNLFPAAMQGFGSSEDGRCSMLLFVASLRQMSLYRL